MTTNSSEIYEQADNLTIGQKKGKSAPIIYKCARLAVER